MQSSKNINEKFISLEMYSWAKELFPISRSITGEGVRETLNYIKKLIPNLNIQEIKSGQKIFDWKVPSEWKINAAYIQDVETGEKVIDIKNSNLHILGYSKKIDEILSIEDIKRHLYTLPESPTAIPYVTSYYEARWGFCLSELQRELLIKPFYKVYIDSEFIDYGSMTFADLIIPGESKSEILLSSYICHPSMANNELSGPVLLTALARYLMGIENRKYSYRIIFVPETIGSIAYISKNLRSLKKNVIAGFVLTCVGDDRAYSYLKSKYGNSLSDSIALRVLRDENINFTLYDYLQRGSDERQYGSPNVNLPIGSVMRSKYGTYPEYHSSLDNMELISAKGLEGSYSLYTKIIDYLEKCKLPVAATYCEPQMGRRNLYPTLGVPKHSNDTKSMMDVLAYCDGCNDLHMIANYTQLDVSIVNNIIDVLYLHKLVKFK